MEYDLSLRALINAGGAFLFLLLGIAIPLVARGSRRGMLIGALAASWGISATVSNLLVYATVTAGAEPWIVAGLTAPAAVFAVVLAIDLAKAVSAGWRRFIMIIATAMAASLAALLIVLEPLARRGVPVYFGAGYDAYVVMAALSAFVGAFVVLLAASVARFHAYPAEARTERRAMGLLVLSFGIFTLVNNFVNGASGARLDSWNAWIGYASLATQAVAAVVASAALLVPSPGHEPRLAKAVFAVLLAAGALGVAINDGYDFGAYGIARTVGVGLLIVAILNHDLLGVPLPTFAVGRGLLTGGALATLFIVAQVAQNFLSARYGLLMGGVVAGVVVFAASPIQRAIERAQEDKSRKRAGTSAVAYKAALRAAMRDGKLTRREERHLAEAAMALGISPVQALDLRDEVEREPA